MEKLLTVDEAANLLAVKCSTIRKWTHIGFIPYVKLGGAVRFQRQAIADWVKKNSKKGRRNVVPAIEL